MSDTNANLLERLRKDAEWYATFGDDHATLVQTLREALTAFDALVAERDKYRDALSGYVNAHHRELHIGAHHEWELRVTDAVRDAARAALRDDTAAVPSETPHPKWCEKHSCWFSLSTRSGRSCCWVCETEASPAAVPSGDAEEEGCVYPKCIGWDGECNSVCDGGPPASAPVARREEHDG